MPLRRKSPSNSRGAGFARKKGREVRLVRPRVDLSFMADATAIYSRGIKVTLRIKTDADGKTTSCGNRQIVRQRT